MGGGGGHQAFGDSGNLGDSKPWGNDQSGGNLARDAGVNDIGSSGRGGDNSRAGLFGSDSNADSGNDNSRSGWFDTASNDDDHDDMDLDSDDFGDSDTA
jgi:hypothetical protein